jgi:hypothetical protein
MWRHRITVVPLLVDETLALVLVLEVVAGERCLQLHLVANQIEKLFNYKYEEPS